MSDRPMQPLRIAAGNIARLEVCVIMIITGATGYYCYLGASAIEPNSDWMTKAGCALFATSVTAGLYLFWRALLSQVPMLPHRARWLAAPIVALVVVFAVGVSTFFNLSGMIGAEAVRHHMEVSLETFSDALATARNQAHQGLEGASAIRLNLAKFQQMAGTERTGGGTIGVPGSGAVTGMLEQVAAVMAAAVHDADAKSALADKLTIEAENNLGAMRAAINDPALNLQAKTARFTKEAEALRLGLLQLSRLEIVSTVRQAVAAARETVKPALSNNHAIAERQQKTIDDLTQRLNRLNSLNQVAAQATPIPALGKPFQSITVYDAVLRHMGDYIPAALAALFIDILPLPLLLLKILVIGGMNGTASSDVAARYTVHELIEMRELMGQLGLVVPVQQIMRSSVMPAADRDNSRYRMPVLRAIPNRSN